jgi:hypothetical protein
MAALSPRASRYRRARIDGSRKAFASSAAPSMPESSERRTAVELPGVLDGHQLRPAVEADTVRVGDGGVEVRDGPRVPQGAELGGYDVYEAAVAFAAKIPVSRLGGSVEVRVLREP